MAGTDLVLLTIVWAAGAGLLAQLLAHRLRIPAIVPLLAVGVVLGPSGLAVVHPAALGGGLPVIVKLAVAVVDVVLGITGVHSIGFLGGSWAYVGRLFIGMVVGAAGGLVLTWLLKRPRLVPAELANIVSLASAWVAFGTAEWFHGESGIT